MTPARLLPSRWGALLVVAGLAALAFTRQASGVLLLTRAFVWAILALSAWFLLRVTGRASLGNATFFGVAAYATGLCATRWGIDNIWLTLAIAITVAATAGLLVGAASGRLGGFHFLLITLAFAEMFRAYAVRSEHLGGEDGIAGIGRPSTWPLPLDLTNATTLMWFTGAALAVTVLALVVVLRSPFGACVIGVRDSPGRMAALGYSPTAYRIAGVVVASTVAGMAGVLNAYVVRFVSPTEFAPLVSAKSLLFTVVGGSGMLGSVVAATVLTFLEDELSTRFDRWLTVLGLVYVAIAMIGERTARRALRPVGILVARTSGAVRRRPRSDASGHVPLVQTVEVEA